MSEKKSNTDTLRKAYEKAAADVAKTAPDTPERAEAMEAKKQAHAAFTDAQRQEERGARTAVADAKAEADEATRKALEKAHENDPVPTQTEPNFGLTTAPVEPSPANAAFERDALRNVSDEDRKKAEASAAKVQRREARAQE